MQFQQILRNDAEKVFVVVTNVGAAITKGMGVCYVINNASITTGNRVIPSDADGNATDQIGFIGIAAADIAVDAVGRVQCFGYVDSVLVSHVGSSITITMGDPMIPGRLAGGMFTGAPTILNGGLKYVIVGNLTPATISAATYVNGFIRAL